MEAIGRLDIPETIRRLILEILASQWNAKTLREAFQKGERTHLAGMKTIGEYAQLLLVPWMATNALPHLARSPQWHVRSLVALHPQTPEESIIQLARDGNRYVRALASARTALTAV
jgi:hypothetical protein